MAAMLSDSTVAAVVRTRPRAIPLAMITMRESHGFPFVSDMSMGLRYNISVSTSLADRGHMWKVEKFCLPTWSPKIQLAIFTFAWNKLTLLDVANGKAVCRMSKISQPFLCTKLWNFAEDTMQECSLHKIDLILKPLTRYNLRHCSVLFRLLPRRWPALFCDRLRSSLHIISCFLKNVRSISAIVWHNTKKWVFFFF